MRLLIILQQFGLRSTRPSGPHTFVTNFLQIWCLFRRVPPFDAPFNALSTDKLSCRSEVSSWSNLIPSFSRHFLTSICASFLRALSIFISLSEYVLFPHNQPLWAWLWGFSKPRNMCWVAVAFKAFFVSFVCWTLPLRDVYLEYLFVHSSSVCSFHSTKFKTTRSSFLRSALQPLCLRSVNFDEFC